MRCKKVEKLLPAYVDGALPERAATRVEKHVARCDRCAALLQLHRGVLERWQDLEAVEPERDLWPQIAAELAANGPESRRTWFSELWQPVFGWPAPALGVLLFVLAVGVGLLSYRLTHPPVRTPSQVTGVAQTAQSSLELAYDDAPEIFEAAATVLSETRKPTVDKLLPAKAEVVGQAVLQLQSDPFLSKQLKPLLDDVEIALTELSAAGDAPSAAALQDVQKLIREKNLLVRLSVAKSVLNALTESEEMPPDILAAYLQPPR